jgi:DNA-binding NtrC family response regulator
MGDNATMTLSSLSLSAATFAEHFTLPTFKLRVASGPDAGLEATFARRTVVIGSSPDCDFALSDGAASRQHLRIVGERSGYRLSDLASKNGTWFAGSRVVELVLGAQATLRIGQNELTFQQLPELHEVSLSREPSFGALHGRSDEMREVFARLAALADSDAPVAIEGEPGTGKQRAAEALHLTSKRADRPLWRFDCSLTHREFAAEQLLGADDQLGAWWSETRGGTAILLDLDELDAELQGRLAAALASSLKDPSGPRLVATFSCPIAQANREGRLHRGLPKLFQRERVTLPPLRHRVADIPDLVDEIVEQLQRSDPSLPPLVLGWRTLQALQAYPWPGNISELRRHVERAAHLATARPTEVHASSPRPEAPAEVLDASELLPYADARRRAVAAFDRLYCQQALRAAGGQMAAAAAAAGVPRSAFEQLAQRALAEPARDL